MAQPAIVAFQWAVLEVLRTQFNVQITDFDYAMGHSVGEMSAMVAACSIDPTAAIKLAARIRSLNHFLMIDYWICRSI
jgi:malonyl CoA-acyl carrier protein transacylase